ncbi:EGF domain-specific O-linked N-acetylglucosamine transferase-like [Gigantopelta aegis]|uniref:EGF domain-specific O-linked N-acetylglucosamine transferase-like n=1 Tax=Gigantopelta aegis TaxID=1735272 RepID=UPI001B88775C|nr:EGF domain-specific O-linked N-acetylglucosamine transferase-like [Gigantopelta aegis]XP_041350091.1 EGF domain-specific O-linked N-acetylglucosamine transferase-like [Gigantopelta aegis]XP_041350092.1 EGF domain-specific O-linked N-acetylglucosamine transferase-like [Gigantopelta aegis]XP_041350093.1 EGF domain-specific O-linked N-acetylglucosamine transferase-like [Gigantopelta aegis]XP_041350094.1 EGF domain-specific O-linked N-acetylglucosamine transferase-like [Gigantopelta aegis]
MLDWQWLTRVSLVLVVTFDISVDCVRSWLDLNIPQEHVPYFFTNNPHLRRQCLADSSCPYKNIANVTKCWGYESGCHEKNRMSSPQCPEDANGWVNTKKLQVEKFWNSADFGYVTERKKELTTFCEGRDQDDSTLECVRYFRYCKATNIYMDLRKSNIRSGTNRYREDIFTEGQIGGHCKLKKDAVKQEGEHKSPLQSWFAELENYSSLDFHPIKDNKCDIVVEKPTYFIKLDAGVNMYHHFCDYVNLYISQHFNNSFSTDVNIVMWDTSPMYYGDFFEVTWEAFTDHPVIYLKQFDGIRVCFRQAVFSFLARMRFGLYYNMPLIPGCYGSSLIRAFSQHVLHRLQIQQNGPLESKIRVTLLTRSTTYRNILNANELVAALKTVGEFQVINVDFNRDISFKDQLKISHNSDILIGIHGAGLTHMLFQPDWAVIMEIYNCEDSGCYFDLSRLRGLKYMTWERKDKMVQEDEGHHPTLGAHAKFTNYSFDRDEFLRLVFKAADHVRTHPKFIADRKRVKNRKKPINDEL